MGGKLSKPRQTYEQQVRYDVNRSHQAPLVSSDVSRLAAHEMHNFHRHAHNESTSMSHLSLLHNPTMGSVSLPSTNSQRAARYDRCEHDRASRVAKSRSFERLHRSNTVITAEQLINSRVKRRPPSRSTTQTLHDHSTARSSSLATVQRLQSRTKRNAKIPDDLQFVLINPQEILVDRTGRTRHVSSLRRHVERDRLDVSSFRFD
jgi:hypothetical protein